MHGPINIRCYRVFTKVSLEHNAWMPTLVRSLYSTSSSKNWTWFALEHLCHYKAKGQDMVNMTATINEQSPLLPTQIIMCIHATKVSHFTHNQKVKAVPSAVKVILLFSKTSWKTSMLHCTELLLQTMQHHMQCVQPRRQFGNALEFLAHLPHNPDLDFQVSVHREKFL